MVCSGSRAVSSPCELVLHAPNLQDPQQRLPNLVIGRRCSGRNPQIKRPLWHPVGDRLLRGIAPDIRLVPNGPVPEVDTLRVLDVLRGRELSAEVGQMIGVR